jgi:glycogen operon protein
MTDAEWEDASIQALGLRLAGDALNEKDEYGNVVTGDTLLIILNGDATELEFPLPRLTPAAEQKWNIEIDTYQSDVPVDRQLAGGATVWLAPLSLMVLRQIEVAAAP